MDGKKSPTTKPSDFSNDTERLLAETREALRLGEESLAPLQTNTEEQNSSKQNISEAQPARRPASSAPAPIVPVGGVSYRPPRPKRTQMPMDWPAYYPNHLIPQTEKVVAEAVKKFPEQTQNTELCEWVVSTLTPDFCAAVQGKTLRADLASYRMDNLLDCLLRYNCDDLENRYRLKKKVVNSDEWKKLVDEIARVHSAAVNDPSDTHLEAEATGAPTSNLRLDTTRVAIGVIKGRNPGISQEEICVKLDVGKIRLPIKSWHQISGERLWTDVFRHPKTKNRVKKYISTAPPIHPTVPSSKA